MQINIDWKNIEKSVEKLAAEVFGGFTGHALKDFRTFRMQVQDDLTEYTVDLAKGDINQEEFNDLVAGEKEELACESLKETGLAEVALDKFTSGVIQLLIAGLKAGIKL